MCFARLSLVNELLEKTADTLHCSRGLIWFLCSVNSTDVVLVNLEADVFCEAFTILRRRSCRSPCLHGSYHGCHCTHCSFHHSQHGHQSHRSHRSHHSHRIHRSHRSHRSHHSHRIHRSHRSDVLNRSHHSNLRLDGCCSQLGRGIHHSHCRHHSHRGDRNHSSFCLVCMRELYRHCPIRGWRREQQRQ